MIDLTYSKHTGNLYNKSPRPKLQLPDTEKHLLGRIPVGWAVARPYVKAGRSPTELSSSSPLFIKTVPVKRGATTA